MIASVLDRKRRLVVDESLLVPAIAIDGTAGSGKGTLAKAVAQAMGFRLVDSGALYRCVALLALREGQSLDDEAGAVRIAREMPLTFDDGKFIISGEDVTVAIRSAEVSARVPSVGKIAGVRAEVDKLQRLTRVLPGVVADGRDMWSVFPTPVMFYVDADIRARAMRRHSDLRGLGSQDNIGKVLQELQLRDWTDKTRPVSPLVCHPDAFRIDTTHLTTDQELLAVMSWYNKKKRWDWPEMRLPK